MRRSVAMFWGLWLLRMIQPSSGQVNAGLKASSPSFARKSNMSCSSFKRCTTSTICAADTVGLFQTESRAQQAMLPRLRCFYNLIVQVAIVRLVSRHT